MAKKKTKKRVVITIEKSNTKIMKKTSKKKKRREIDVFSIEGIQNEVCRRHGISKLPRRPDGWPMSHRVNKLDNLRSVVEAFDVARFRDLKQSVKYRRQIFARIPKFEALIKKEFKSQIKVEVYLGQQDEICITTVFRPRKGQLPFVADDCVETAFEKSGLAKYMDLIGFSHCCGGKDDGLRDMDFTERKYRPED